MSNLPNVPSPYFGSQTPLLPPALPTVTPGTDVASATVVGSDAAGIITLVTSSTAPPAGTHCTLTFANPFPVTPTVIITCPISAGGTPSVCAPYQVSNTGFAVSGVALAATAQYTIFYLAVGFSADYA